MNLCALLFNINKNPRRIYNYIQILKNFFKTLDKS